MTEPYNPFGGIEEPALPADEPAQDSRRNLLVLGGLAAVLLAGGAYFLLSGGEDVVEDVALVPGASRAAAPAVSAPPQAIKLPVATQVQLGRNPFKALYVQPAPPATPVTPVAPTAPTATTPVVSKPVVIVMGGGAAVPAPSSGGGTGSPARPAPVTAPPPAAKEYKLVLTRVFGEGSDLSAVFTIDGEQQTAKVGSVFGPTAQIKLLSLQEGPKKGEWTAVLQVGDGDPFDAVTGQAVFVR